MKVYIVMETECHEVVNVTVYADNIKALAAADASENYAYVIEQDVL